MKVAKVIWTKFNLFQGYDHFRWKQCANNPAWWKGRAELMRQYIAPSLWNLQSQDWELWTPFMKETIDSGIADPVLRILEELNAHISLNKPEPMRVYYKDKCDYLIQLWLDSDDMYHERIWEQIAKKPLQPGTVLVFNDGFCLDTRKWKLYRWLAKGSPPGFFAYVWTRKSLSSPKEFFQYGKRAGFLRRHFELLKCPRAVVMPNSLYCATMSGHNTTKDISRNKAAQRHCGPEIKDLTRKRSILERFGVGEFGEESGR